MMAACSVLPDSNYYIATLNHCYSVIIYCCKCHLLSLNDKYFGSLQRGYMGMIVSKSLLYVIRAAVSDGVV